MKTKTKNYDLFVGVHDDYLFIEAFPYEDGIRSHQLKIPMEKLYAEEISYALDMEEWDTQDLEGFTDKQKLGDFVKPEMPKLLAWWTHFLPRKVGK